MLSLPKPKAFVIRESKIVHRSPRIHPMARFVTEDAVCLMFDIKYEDIYVVECWRYVVYVHAKGVSKFVSYADFPPILGVQLPTRAEMVKWRRRWRKQHHSFYRNLAPKWWVDFLIKEMHQANSRFELHHWQSLLGAIQFAFAEDSLRELQQVLVCG
ncbi:hypothetical protein [Calothrix sp. 336/3]|uniref:hypothetical protein n=1 Tax=Calothrix sp. 336/3 TaxID=1337936 RepID=UPI0004E3E338|nr:hypothetical protein [Calothrix sp. 336/3]AKG21815.1 hypothetical protein IJ00_11590 [Calothrix sp. 336/3]